MGAGVIPRQNFSGCRGHTHAELQRVQGSYPGRILVGVGVIPRQNISGCMGSYLGRISVGAGVIPRQNNSGCRGHT